MDILFFAIIMTISFKEKVHVFFLCPSKFEQLSSPTAQSDRGTRAIMALNLQKLAPLAVIFFNSPDVVKQAKAQIKNTVIVYFKSILTRQSSREVHCWKVCRDDFWQARWYTVSFRHEAILVTRTLRNLNLVIIWATVLTSSVEYFSRESVTNLDLLEVIFPSFP